MREASLNAGMTTENAGNIMKIVGGSPQRTPFDQSEGYLYISNTNLPFESTYPRYIPAVLNGKAMLPWGSIAIKPPVPPSLATLSRTACAASLSDIPRYSIRAEISCPTAERIKYSPSPVPETAHVALFA